MARPAKTRRQSVKADALDKHFSPLLDADPAPADARFTVETTVWRYPGTGGWHFATLPPAVSARIRSSFGKSKRGWGAIPVQVRIGDTQWETSLFPSRKTGAYLFAIKATVRKAEGIADGSRITACVSIR